MHVKKLNDAVCDGFGRAEQDTDSRDPDTVKKTVLFYLQRELGQGKMGVSADLCRVPVESVVV